MERDPLKPGPEHRPAQDVVGDAENIEAGRSGEVDHPSERKLAVAPRRVRVQFAEQGARAFAHSPRSARGMQPGG
jgi:hypothetical protein